jgi:hypothetical protein
MDVRPQSLKLDVPHRLRSDVEVGGDLSVAFSGDGSSVDFHRFIVSEFGYRTTLAPIAFAVRNHLSLVLGVADPAEVPWVDAPEVPIAAPVRSISVCERRRPVRHRAHGPIGETATEDRSGNYAVSVGVTRKRPD